MLFVLNAALFSHKRNECLQTNKFNNEILFRGIDQVCMKRD